MCWGKARSRGGDGPREMNEARCCRTQLNQDIHAVILFCESTSTCVAPAGSTGHAAPS